MFKVEDIVKRVSAPVDYAGASNTPIGEARKIAEETTELVEAAAKLRLLEQLEDRAHEAGDA